MTDQDGIRRAYAERKAQNDSEREHYGSISGGGSDFRASSGSSGREQNIHNGRTME